MADTSFTQTVEPIDLIELTPSQAQIMMIALDIGAYPDQAALLQAGFAEAKAKVDLWAAEMARRAEGPWLDGKEVFDRFRQTYADRAKQRGE